MNHALLLRFLHPWYLLFLFVMFFSCRKTDTVKNEKTVLPTEDGYGSFFRAHPSVDPAIIKVQNFVKGQESQYHFISNLVTRIGLPYWDKSLLFGSSGKPNRSLSAARTGDDTLVVYIPFVRDSGKQVNALLAVRMIAADTAFRIFYDWQYDDLGFNDVPDTVWNAKNMFQMFSLFDYKIFNRKQFLITDGRIFDRNKTDTVLVTIKSIGGDSLIRTARESWYIIETCITYTYQHSNRTMKTDVIPMDDSYTICTYSIESGGGTVGGSGGGGGGGGTGGGSGWGDPCVPTPNPNQPRLDDVTPCGGTPGWQPPAYVLTTQDLRIFAEIEAEDAAADALLNKDCQGTNRSGNIAWAGTLEHWMIMIDYVIKNPLTGQIEYQIPGSGVKNGRPGYADIVNSGTGDVFEIKPNNPTGVSAGQTEVTNYVLKA